MSVVSVEHEVQISSIPLVHRSSTTQTFLPLFTASEQIIQCAPLAATTSSYTGNASAIHRKEPLWSLAIIRRGTLSSRRRRA